MSDNYFAKCTKLIGGFTNHGEVKTRLSSTMETSDGDLISLVHPIHGEIQLRINNDGTVRILADEKFKLERVNMIGRIVKVEYFADPE